MKENIKVLGICKSVPSANVSANLPSRPADTAPPEQTEPVRIIKNCVFF